jgi:Tfp pilus assembly protein PilO
MNALQLEFNFENKAEIEVELEYMRKQIAEMHESMGKVRRKMFAELGELKKLCSGLKDELADLKVENIEFTYGQEGSLFNVSEH